MSDQYIKEASSLMEQAKGALSAGAGKAQEMAGNPDIQKLLPYLLAGGAGAVGGAALTGKRNRRSGESRGQYLTRILRNAVVAGGLAGGGSYLAGEGFKKTLGSVDLENPITGKEGDQGPLATGVRNTAFSPVTAGLAGTAGLIATARAGQFGANPNAAEAGEQMMSGIKQRLQGQDLPDGISNAKSVEMLSKRDPAGLKSLLGGDQAIIQEAKRFGINTHDPTAASKVPELLKKLLGGRGTAAVEGVLAKKPLLGLHHKAHTVGSIPSHLVGRTPLRRAGRAGIFAGAAAIPSIIGALATDSPE